MSDNVTTTTLYKQPNQKQLKFLYLSFYIVLMIVDLWLIISLIHYGIKTKKWRGLQPWNPNLLNSGRIYLSVVICSVAAFVYHLFVAVYYNIEFRNNEDTLCKVIGCISIITYGFCFLSVILFLWFRQRMLYTAFLPLAHFTKSLKFFSFIIIFVTFFLVVVGVILSISVVIFTRVGCFLQNDSNLQLAAIASFVCAMIFSQVSLLVIFIHALLSSQGFNVKKRSLFCCKHQPENRQKANRTGIMVNKIVKKATVFAALSLLSDLLALLLSLPYLLQDKQNEIYSVLASLSVSMKLYFVILSFIVWKDMITSPCKSFFSR